MIYVDTRRDISLHASIDALCGEGDVTSSFIHWTRENSASLVPSYPYPPLVCTLPTSLHGMIEHLKIQIPILQRVGHGGANQFAENGVHGHRNIETSRTSICPSSQPIASNEPLGFASSLHGLTSGGNRKKGGLLASLTPDLRINA